jgi:hypothetical protein
MHGKIPQKIHFNYSNKEGKIYKFLISTYHPAPPKKKKKKRFAKKSTNIIELL